MRRACLLAMLCAVGAIVVMSVSGCGGSDGSSGNDESGSADKGEFSGKPSGVVTVWDYEYDLSPLYAEAADEIQVAFEKKYPDVTVNRVKQPFDTYPAVAQTAFTSKEGADVMMMGPGALGVTYWAKGLEKLNDLIPKEEQEKILGWEMTNPEFRKGGDYYAMPVTFNGYVFYYNKKLFKRAGLPTDFSPKTWEEVKEAGEKLEAAGIPAFTSGNKEGYENCYWFSTGWQTRGTFEESAELANGEMSFTDETVERAFEPEIMMQEAGLYSDNRFTTPLFTEGFAQFGEEKGAMVYGFAAGFGYWGEYNEALGEKNVGVFFPPESNYMSYETVNNWTIPKFAENKPAALAFVEFMGSKEAVEAIAKHTGQIPNRTDIDVPSEGSVQEREIVKYFNEMDKAPIICGMNHQPVQEGLNLEMNEVLQQRTGLQSILETAQENAEKEGS